MAQLKCVKWKCPRNPQVTKAESKWWTTKINVYSRVSPISRGNQAQQTWSIQVGDETVKSIGKPKSKLTAVYHQFTFSLIQLTGWNHLYHSKFAFYIPTGEPLPCFKLPNSPMEGSLQEVACCNIPSKPTKFWKPSNEICIGSHAHTVLTSSVRNIIFGFNLTFSPSPDPS